MQTLVKTRKHRKAMARQRAMFFKTKGSTLRNFSVVRIFEGYYTVYRFVMNLDLSLSLNFFAREVEEGLPNNLVEITDDQYDDYIKMYKQHVKMLLLKSGANPKNCPKVGLSNPHWRMEISKNRKAPASI